MPSFDRETGGLTAGFARAAVVCLALCLLLAASASAAAPNWLEPADLSKPGRNASNPAVAMDAAGNTIAIWARKSTFDESINLQISSRSAGSAFTDPVDFTRIEADPQLAITPAGEAVAAWKYLENPPGNHVIQVSTRPPGGSFSPPITIPTKSPSEIPQEPRVAIGDGGDIVVTWSEFDPDSSFTEFPDVHCGTNPNPPNGPIQCPNPNFVMAAVRPAGGVFTEARQISPPLTTPPAGEPELEEWAIEESAKAAAGARPVMDAAGNATVLFSYRNGEKDVVVESTERPAGGEFGGLEQVTAPGEDAGLPEIGVDTAGNTIASWARNDGPHTIVQAAIKAPGGAFTSLGDVSPADEVAERPVLDVAPGGGATAVWSLAGGEDLVQSATRPAGGAFGPPVTINGSNDGPLFHEVSVSNEGDAIVVWSGDNNSNEIVRAAVRPAGSASFGPPVAISQSGEGPFHPHPSMDAGGDATVVWERFNGTSRIVQWAGYDADPPQFGAVSIPSSAMVGETVPFSASASDVWPVGKPSFEFGDGADAEGNVVSHVYSAPGSYPVAVTVKDALGKTATRSGTLLVKARNHFTIGKLTRNRKKGTATLTVTVPEPGTLVASGKGMKKATVRAAKASAVKVPIKSAGKSLKRLKAKGKLRLKLKIAYSPVGGDTSTQPYRVTLQKKLH